MIHRDKRRRNKPPNCLYDIMKILKGTPGPTVRTLKEPERQLFGGGVTNVFHLPFLCIFIFGDVVHNRYLHGQESVRRTNGTGANVFGGWGTLSGSVSGVLTTAAARARNHKHGGRDTAPGLGVIKRKPFQ